MSASQLVLQFRGTRIEDEDEVLEVEDALFAMLAGGDTLDGHDILPAARNIHILADDPAATFQRLRPFLERAGLLDHIVAAARPSPAAPFAVLWPRELLAAFSLS